jgi:hypothetical protein
MIGALQPACFAASSETDSRKKANDALLSVSMSAGSVAVIEMPKTPNGLPVSWCQPCRILPRPKS